MKQLVSAGANWSASAFIAVFLGFVVEVLKWNDLVSSSGFGVGVLSLLGLWLICYWAVVLEQIPLD